MRSFLTFLVVAAGASSFGQIVEGRLNLRISCPNGASSCWPQVRESIQFSGFEVTGKLDLATMTVPIRPKPGTPSLILLLKEVRALGAYYDVRGIEILVEGKLVRDRQGTRIEIPGAEAFRLSEPRFRLEQGLNEPHGRALRAEDRRALAFVASKPSGSMVRLLGIWRAPDERAARTLEVLRASAP